MIEIRHSESEPISEVFVISGHGIEASINSRGANLTSLEINKTPIIYKPTKEKPSRGGVPVLGPTPGPIKGTSWEHLYPNMPSHGMDRVEKWNVIQVGGETVQLSRRASPSEFLFAGEIRMTFSIHDSGIVIITKTVINHEEKPREIGHGFHPYFPNKETRWDPELITEERIQKLKNGESIIINGVERTAISIDGKQFSIESSPNPEQTVIWTDDYEKYLCVEPWWSGIGKGVMIAPLESVDFSLTIRQIN